MTPEEIATVLATLSITDLPDVINLTFNKVEELRSVEEVQAYFEVLLECGVDVRPICKKKHPTT